MAALKPVVKASLSGKLKKPIKPEAQAPVKAEVANAEKEKAQESKPVLEAPKLKRGCGCCDVHLAKLQHGQKYFEAPDGHVIIGEEEKQQINDRRLNNGKGGWINPMR